MSREDPKRGIATCMMLVLTTLLTTLLTTPLMALFTILLPELTMMIMRTPKLETQSPKQELALKLTKTNDSPLLAALPLRSSGDSCRTQRGQFLPGNNTPAVEMYTI